MQVCSIGHNHENLYSEYIGAITDGKTIKIQHHEYIGIVPVLDIRTGIWYLPHNGSRISSRTMFTEKEFRKTKDNWILGMVGVDSEAIDA